MKVEIVKPGNAVKRIENQLLLLDKAFLPPLSGRVDIDQYAEKLSKNAFIVYATEDEDLGHCAFYINDVGVAFISSFGVRKEFQGKNIGSRIMANMKETCLQMFCKEIDLEVYRENTSAICFYKKHGFIITEESKEWYKMQCQLRID